jgi:hypothetical protein
VDPASSIGKKWLKMGAATSAGNPIGPIESVPLVAAQYQRFEGGVIVTSVDWGAVFLPTSVFDEWLSLEGQVNALGQNLLAHVGLPTRDGSSSGGVDQGHFERGWIVARPSDGTAWTVSGVMYRRVVELAGAAGLPVGEESGALGNRTQPFEHGTLFWVDAGSPRFLWGDVLARWSALGGASATIGRPTSDVMALMNADGVPIGRTARFTGGAIYATDALGAWELTGAIRDEYEGSLGGPNGWLGLPISGMETAGSGDPYADFQGGVVVDHRAADAYQGVVAFGGLDWYLDEIQGYGGDCTGCGGLDVYFYLTLSDSDGTLVDHARYPSEPGTNYGSAEVLNMTWSLTDALRGSFWVRVRVAAWDEDDTSDDDRLGVVDRTFGIDTLWGLTEGGEFTEYNDDRSNSFTIWMNPKKRATSPPTDFPVDLFWRFSNFETPTLTFDQYARTFEDVDPEEGWEHPFDKAFYELVYEDLADGGNCFGMSLESIYVGVAASPFAAPLSDYYPTIACGEEPVSSLHGRVMDEINVKHGYQVGGDAVEWTVAMFLGGLTHDPKTIFEATKLAADLGSDPVINIFDSYLFGSGHTVRPYQWEKGLACASDDGHRPPDECWRIGIADPNHPAMGYTGGVCSRQAARHIEINATHNTYAYDDYSGGLWSGGRMYFHPFSVLDHTPLTPVGEVFQLLTEGALVLLGSDGGTSQVTDAAGRTLFEAGTAVGPRRWDQVREDASQRIPNLAPIRVASSGAPQKGEAWLALGAGYSHSWSVSAAPGRTYEWTFQSGTLGARVTAPGGGDSDVLTARDVGTAAKRVTVERPAGGPDKELTWILAAGEKSRWSELTHLKTAAGQVITARLENGGYKLVFENDGPTTTAELRVRAGPGASPVVVGDVTIPGNSSTEFEFDTPKTTLTFVGDWGASGWLVSHPIVTLSAFDYSSTGIAWIEYSISGGPWLRTPAAVVTFVNAVEGESVVAFRARDNAGNQEAAKEEPFKIDTRAPVVEVSVDQPYYLRTEPVRLHFSATDPAPGSGIAVAAADLDGVAVTDGQSIDLLWYPLGTHVLTGTASDVAGWGTTRTASFELVATVRSLTEEIAALRARGEIDRDGVARSLLVKSLAATAASDREQVKTQLNQLRALVHQLRAQSDQHITGAAADLLLADIAYVIAHLP